MWLYASNRWFKLTVEHSVLSYIMFHCEKLKLRSRFAMLAQTQGANHIRLQPKEECESKCAVLQFSLFRGEIRKISYLKTKATCLLILHFITSGF